ncbi:MAG: hypothetical protein Q9159_000252 [Coniocarpon cinnabarinum]
MPVQSSPTPHSVVYVENRQTIYSTYPNHGVVTATNLKTSQQCILCPRGIIREPTSISYATGVTRPHLDITIEDIPYLTSDDVDCDSLFVSDEAGCRIWQIVLGDSGHSDTPKLIYQAYCSTELDLTLNYSLDYAREDKTLAGQLARSDWRMRCKSVAVDNVRNAMYWVQGGYLMMALATLEYDDRPDDRGDVWVVEEDLEWVTRLTIDKQQRWLLLRNEAGEEARLLLRGIQLANDEWSRSLLYEDTGAATDVNYNTSDVWQR